MRMFKTAVSVLSLFVVACVDNLPDETSDQLAVTGSNGSNETIPVETTTLVLPVAVLVPVPDPAGGETTTGLCIRSASRNARTDGKEATDSAVGQVASCISDAKQACGTGTFTTSTFIAPAWPTIINTLDAIFKGSSCSYQFIGSTWLNNLMIIVTCSQSWTCVKMAPPT